MGLPIEHLVVATNENDVLDEFFRTGIYRVRSSDQTYITSSPSMDISKASNFERFIYDVVGGRGDVVRSLWASVEANGGFDFNQTPYMTHLSGYGFLSGTSTHAERLQCIRETWEKQNVLLDPHTADGVNVARALSREMQGGIPLICLETALPMKFSETIEAAIGQQPSRPESLVGLESLPQRVQVMSADVSRVRQLIESVCA
jgi:threonine synthase